MCWRGRHLDILRLFVAAVKVRDEFKQTWGRLDEDGAKVLDRSDKTAEEVRALFSRKSV
jgi:hypothetical protein